MSGSGRYDRQRPASDQEREEAEALHAIAGLLGRGLVPHGLSRHVSGQISQVLHMTANELSSGRAVAIGVRRAVRGLADAIRRELDPRS